MSSISAVTFQAEQQHMGHQMTMDSQAQLQHHLHSQLQDPGIPPGFSNAEIAAWQQGLSGTIQAFKSSMQKADIELT